ncbi:MAG: hypothetical protein JSS69_03950 [Acidobacteria bacterium]|nr:hypothetical protein [Acidobacteriota bacterium]MBS1865048.1 hypothetical protein [Acidobacteriota bacterium]
MQRIVTLLAAMLALLTLSGCGPEESLFGLGQAAPLDQRLMGKWLLLEGGKPSSDGRKSHVLIRSAADNTSYELDVQNFADDGQTILMSANLVAIDGLLFLDFYPPDPKKSDCKRASFPVVKAHIFARVSIEKDKLNWYFLDDSWVNNQDKEHKLEIASVRSSDGLLLSAESDDLRKFLSKHAEEKEAFSGYYLLTREK